MNVIIERIGSFLIDLVVISIITLVLSFILPLINEGIDKYSVYLGFILILIKDVYSEKGSFGKKILGIKLINKTDFSQVNFTTKILRNVTVFLWPLEGLFLVIFKNRITDFIFKTTVIKMKNN